MHWISLHVPTDTVSRHLPTKLKNQTIESTGRCPVFQLPGTSLTKLNAFFKILTFNKQNILISRKSIPHSQTNKQQFTEYQLPTLTSALSDCSRSIPSWSAENIPQSITCCPS